MGERMTGRRWLLRRDYERLAARDTLSFFEATKVYRSISRDNGCGTSGLYKGKLPRSKGHRPKHHDEEIS